MPETPMVDCTLGRVVLQDGADRQLIYVSEIEGKRGFPIVIGVGEAHEIYRVLHDKDPERPLTHRLAHDLVVALGATLKHVDIVDLRKGTFIAQIALQNEAGDVLAVVDARPSDAIALALRARCKLRVAEPVLEAAAQDGEEAG